MQVDAAGAAPGPLGRDAYRIVQEALTNISKHARGTLAQSTLQLHALDEEEDGEESL